jgi:hypothetical protein
MIPSLAMSKRKSNTSTTPSTEKTKFSSNQQYNNKESKDASDIDILGIPDPPTPDERNHAKTSAAALEMRRKRRKSRGVSGHGDALFQSNATDRLVIDDGIAEIEVNAPFVDVTNNASCQQNVVSNPMEDQLRRAGLIPATNDDTQMELSCPEGASIICQHESGINDRLNSDKMNDSNMDLEDEGESFDLGDGDQESDAKPTSICFDDSDDDTYTKPCIPSQQKNDSDHVSVNKRPRQSMMIPDQDQLRRFLAMGERDELLEEMASPTKRAKLGSPCNIDHAETLPSRSRRSKGRRSLILPSEQDGIDSEQRSVDGDDTFSVAEVCETTFSSCSSKSSIKRSAEEDMDDIKASIRRFCAIPLEKRYTSNDALCIEELTGYPLLTAMDKVNRERMENGTISTPIKLTWASNEGGKISPDALAALSSKMKRNLFEKIRPLVQEMEIKKKEDTAMLEDATNCRVERKKGKFRYVSLATGKKVSSKEYERRYLLQIQEKRETKLIANDKPIIQMSSNDSSNHSDKESLEEAESTKPLLLRDDNNTVSFPSRDDVPSNPDLAAAQRKLFEAWDLALDEYTETVLLHRAQGTS